MKVFIKKRLHLVNYLFLVLLLTNGFFAKASSEDTLAKPYSPKASMSYPVNVFWGDTHLHTNLSLDSYLQGNGLGPEDAYRFAKGEAVKANNGRIAKLNRPLDFLVIADHAINMGVLVELEIKNPDLVSSPLGQQLSIQVEELNTALGSDKKKAFQHFSNLAADLSIVGQLLTERDQLNIWQTAALLADHHNNPGKFTAFVGFEWTELFYNLHRVVIFKDGSEKVVQVKPFSFFDSPDPEALWDYLDNYERNSGGEVLAIPHNGNLSRGVMFALEDAGGNPLSVEYAKTRSRWEPVFEVTQIKGDSETHPLLSPADEFSNYETFPLRDKIYSVRLEELKKTLGLKHYDSWFKKNDQVGFLSQRYGYGRSALKLGLEQQAKLGVNPFKFGMIGSTDSHTSLATADEYNFWGKATTVEPYRNRLMGSWYGEDMDVDPESAGAYSQAWRMSASGYAAIWAEENTRESLFKAMKRREVYASTGPRITVRFFGGWDFENNDALKPEFAQIGYTKGVPMGGDLTNGPKGKSPTFLIRAVRDPDGANLDRVQIIKGWYDKYGELHEKIYNVALSDDRKANKDNKIPPVGSTVNINDASYVNSIGDPELAVVWNDPDFNMNEFAFYYARVLEIPTPRWTAYDAKYFGVEDIPEEVPMITQERAYTSPIWYSPGKF